LLCEATDAAAKLAEQTPADGPAAAAAAAALVEIDEEVGFVFEDQLYFVNGVGGEDAEERSKRKILSPWLKYQWDTYRTVLDVVKNNNKLDVLYHEVVCSALDFCGRFNRTSDFKRLCELLRQHLNTIEKYQGQAHAVNLSSMESILSYLKTRFSQLDQACTMGLWNEALFIIDDINNLNNRGAEMGQQALNSRYYYTFHQRLVQIFWAAENYSYHAFALRQLFNTVKKETSDFKESKESKESDKDSQLREIASCTVLAALVVPLDNLTEEARNNWTYESDDNPYLSEILQCDAIPSRASVIQMIISENILDYADDNVKILFNQLEQGFSPFTVFKKIKPCLDFLSKSSELAKYIPPLEDLIIKRLLQRLAKAYEVLDLAKLSVMAPEFDILRVERLIVDMTSEMDLNVRIDHRQNLFYFSDFDVYGKRFVSKLRAVEEGLSSVVAQVRGETDDALEERRAVFNFIKDGLKEENEFHLTRYRVIERRYEIVNKELQERAERERERENAERIQREKAEALRKQQAAERRAKEKAEKERKEKELRANLAIVEELKKKTEQVPSSAVPTVTKKVEEIADKIETIDREELLRLHHEVLEAEKQAQLQKQRELEKRLDYLVRAERKEEIPKLIQKYETEKLEDREYFQSQYQKMIDDHKLQFDEKLKEKDRLFRLSDAKKEFVKQIMDVRRHTYEQARAEQVARLEKKKAEL
jgi:translation initiation factor 3 subunit A